MTTPPHDQPHDGPHDESAEAAMDESLRRSDARIDPGSGMGVSSERVGPTGPGQTDTSGTRDTSGYVAPEDLDPDADTHPARDSISDPHGDDRPADDTVGDPARSDEEGHDWSGEGGATREGPATDIHRD